MAVKKKIPKRIKTGLAGVPFDKGFESVKFYFFQDLEKKDYINVIKAYIKKKFSTADRLAINANKDYALNFFNYAAMCYWKNAGLELEEELEQALDRFFNGLIKRGNEELKHKVEDQQDSDKVVISPAERLKNKVDETIMQDLNELEDKWMDKETAEIDIYKLFKEYDLKGIAPSIVASRIQRWLDDYTAAYEKTDPDMVEGYSYLTKKELKSRVESCQSMLTDLEKLKATTSRRAPRVKKPKDADKQIAKLQYKENDTNYKLESINPIFMVGTSRIYVFNTKTKKLAEYICESTDGFEISGTSIKNFSEKSRTMVLRKPEVILPIILKGAPGKIKTALDELTTKSTVPNGRINSDTILLKVIK